MKFSSLIMTAGLSVAAAGVFTVAPLALAKEPPVVVTAPREYEALPTQRVSFADLQLERRADRRRLHHRVSDAVDIVCPNPFETFIAEEVRTCRSTAWSGARPQMRRAIELAMKGQSASVATAAITISAGH